MVNPDLTYIQLVLDRDAAEKAYMEQLRALPPVRERTAEQQKVLDNLLVIRQEASRKVWHYHIL